MRLRRAALGLAWCVIAACRGDRSSDANASPTRLRAEVPLLTVPSDPKVLASALGVPPESLRVAGEDRYRRQEFDSARAIWRVEVARAEAAADSPASARARMWLGLAAYKLGDYKSARSDGEASLAMKRKLHMDAELARSFNALGLLAWQEGRLRDALVHYDSALIAAARNADSVGVARALSNIPLVRVELGEFDSAREGFNKALRAAKALDDDLMQGNALANLGMLDVRLGNSTEAIGLLREARKHYKTIEYSAGEANALGQLATAWSNLGDLQPAIAAADSALTIARGEGLQQEIAAELEVLADLQIQAGSPRIALRLLAQADSIDAATGLKSERGANLRRASSILTDLGEYPAAIARAREAITVHHEIEARAEETYDRLQLALALAQNHEQAEAEKQAQAAVGKLGESSRSVRTAVSLVRARLALNSRSPAKALKYLELVPRDASAADWKVADMRAEAFLNLRRFDEALTEGKRAVAALERERGSLGAGPLRWSYLANRSLPFEHLAAVHLARGDTAAAFAVASALPGRTLSESIGLPETGRLSLSSIASTEKLLRRASALETARDSAIDKNNTERIAALERELTTTRVAYENLLSTTALAPEARTLGVTNVAVSDVQRRLNDDEALLLYLSGPSALDLFVVRRTSYRHLSIPIGDRELSQRVRVARSILSASHPSQVASALDELYALLIRPAAQGGALDGARHLLIVPHGALGVLPFAALRDGSSGRFLVESHTLTYLPSVSLVARSVSSKRSRRLMVFAPLPDSLPGTLREARAIADENPDAELKMQNASTEAAVRNALSSGASVHIASHGSHNPQNPLFSRMIVGRQGKRVAESEDGRLEVHEIIALRSSSPVVFLSGCETGVTGATQDAFDRSSDQGSLAQAFLIAGARTVVATLWRVNDVSAATLARDFYRETSQGREPAEALAIAQRKAIGGAQYTWAAYTVSGR